MVEEKKDVSWQRMLLLKHLLCVLGLIALVVWGCSSPPLSSDSDHFALTPFHTGWSQEVGGELVPLDDLQNYLQVPAGDALTFTCTLPQLSDGWAFIFYSNDKEVTCYVDGVCIQNFTMQEGFTQLQTPGSTWNQVDLTQEMSGKTCTLVFHSPLGRYESLCNVYLVENQYVNNVRFSVLWSSILLAVELFILVIVFCTAGLVMLNGRRKRYLLSIATFFLVVLLWLLAELNAYDIFFARPVVSYLIGEFFKRLVPLTLLTLSKYSISTLWYPKLFRGLQGVAWINFILPFVLLFTLDVSLVQSEPYHYIVSGVIAVATLGVIGRKILRFKELSYQDYGCLAVPILILGCVMDVIVLSGDSLYAPYAGLWTAVGAIAFSYATVALFFHISAKMEQEKLAVELSYRTLQNTTLVYQIKTHFIFNALNAIRAMCRENPEEADRVLVEFAGYLRGYSSLINAKENVAFDREMKLVQQYLSVEHSRFEEKCQYSFQIACTDFVVPPLSVYTLVENAVIHGVRGKEEGGHILVTAKRIGRWVEVTVEDTGAGFDTTQPIREGALGMQNVETRLKLMCDGTMAVDSQIGVGTKITLRLPQTS